MEYREFVCAAIETMNQKEGKNGIQAREHRAVKTMGRFVLDCCFRKRDPICFRQSIWRNIMRSFKRGNSGTDCVGDQPALSKDQGKNIIDVDSFLIWNHGRISWGSK